MSDRAPYELFEYVAGTWATPQLADGRWIHDPNDAARLVPMRSSSPESVERALASADRLHRAGAWCELPVSDRIAVLRKIAAELEPRRGAMARLDAQLSGVVLSLTEKFATIASKAFAAAADYAEQHGAPVQRDVAAGHVELHRLPLGPAVVIAPWNAPSAIAAHKVASALAAGCTVVLKPSEYAPQSCQILVEAAEAAGLPPGVLSLVHGGRDVGDTLARDARIAAVSFTGGLEGGRAVAHRCAEHIRPVQLELGGNNPLIALAGADIGETARAIAAGLTLLGGQWCRALGRIFVHRSLEAELFDASLEELARVRLGHSLAEGTDMGPMAHEGQRSAVLRAVERLREVGGTPFTRTTLPSLRGFFVHPTLVTGVPSELATTEIFGPVATWHVFDAIDEALEASRLGDYGLAAYVFGPENDARRVARRVYAGSIKVNSVGVFAIDPLAPRPAWGLSGLGDEGIAETMEFFRGTRVVGIARAN